MPEITQQRLKADKKEQMRVLGIETADAAKLDPRFDEQFYTADVVKAKNAKRDELREQAYKTRWVGNNDFSKAVINMYTIQHPNGWPRHQRSCSDVANMSGGPWKYLIHYDMVRIPVYVVTTLTLFFIFFFFVYSGHGKFGIIPASFFDTAPFLTFNFTQFNATVNQTGDSYSIRKFEYAINNRPFIGKPGPIKQQYRIYFNHWCTTDTNATEYYGYFEVPPRWPAKDKDICEHHYVGVPRLLYRWHLGSQQEMEQARNPSDPRGARFFDAYGRWHQPLSFFVFSAFLCSLLSIFIDVSLWLLHNGVFLATWQLRQWISSALIGRGFHIALKRKGVKVHTALRLRKVARLWQNALVLGFLACVLLALTGAASIFVAIRGVRDEWRLSGIQIPRESKPFWLLVFAVLPLTLIYVFMTFVNSRHAFEEYEDAVLGWQQFAEPHPWRPKRTEAEKKRGASPLLPGFIGDYRNEMGDKGAKIEPIDRLCCNAGRCCTPCFVLLCACQLKRVYLGKPNDYPPFPRL